MGCCKCEEYGWKIEPSLETEYNDEHGAYCLFHAPTDLKLTEGVEAYFQIRDFNERLAQHVRAGISGAHTVDGHPYCDLSGVVFPGEVRFDRIAGGKILPTVDFNDAVFFDKVYFDGVRFESKASFNRTKFLEPLVLDVACSLRVQIFNVQHSNAYLIFPMQNLLAKHCLIFVCSSKA